MTEVSPTTFNYKLKKEKQMELASKNFAYKALEVIDHIVMMESEEGGGQMSKEELVNLIYHISHSAACRTALDNGIDTCEHVEWETDVNKLYELFEVKGEYLDSAQQVYGIVTE